MKKMFLMLASVLMSVASFAQWTKPAVPAAQPLTVGDECYLFNVEAEGFLLGANDWNTRASVSPTLGHKVYIEAGTQAESYYITNYVLQGGMANQIGYIFVDGLDAIYVDNTKDGKKNNQYTFEDQGGNVYRIGLSPANETFNDEYSRYLGMDLTRKGDTRIYLVEPENESQINWIFVSPADYATYVVARENYDASVELKAVLDEAKALSVECTEAQAVYNNTSSTAQQMRDAKAALEIVVRAAKLQNASVSNPAEVLAGLGIATDFTDGTCPGWTSTTGASNKQASNGNNAKDYNVTGNHYENWSSGPFTPGKISATAKDIPAGVYHLSALAYSNTGRDVFLYAGDARTPVSATQIDVDQVFDVYTVSDGNLEIGLDVIAKGPNWVGLDNVYLYYMGASDESYAYLTEKALAAVPPYEEMQNTGNLRCQKAAYEAYVEAKAAFQAATADNYAAAFKAYCNATEALNNSVAAYEAYALMVEQANEWLQNSPVENEYIELLGAYVNDDEATGYNGHGTALNVLAAGELNVEQMTAESKYLEGLLYDAKTNSMADGDDCTNLLVNPNFSEAGGWTAAQGINWPAGDVATFPVFEAYGRVCDVYQQLTGLQNGVYEMSLQAVYSATEEIRQTYAYINDYETKIGVLADGDYINDAAGASEAFAEGRYPVTVYGIVTDGTMRIGIANRLRTNESASLWAGGVKLTFRAKNAEALQSLIAEFLPEAKAMLDSKCGTPELDALEAAIGDAETARSAADLYDAAIGLKAAMDAVKAGVEVYKNLEVAVFNLEQTMINAPENADKVTLEAAKAYYDEAYAAFADRTYSTEEAQAAIEKLNSYSVAIKMGQSIASEENPVDYSSAIVNNTFDPSMGNKDEKRIDGWVVSGALNGYKKNTASFNKGTFDLHQDLVGLPKGKYKVTVHTYYRAGSYEEEETAINNGQDTHLMKLYAGEEETNIMNLSEGAKDVTLPEGINTRTICGITVPDGTDASVACFNAGLYLNELVFNVGEDGKATIGIKLDQTIGTNDYSVVGAWNLWYMGDPTPAVTEQDVTSLIVNNNFDPSMGNKDEKRIDGWKVEGALNGYKKYTASFNKGTFNLSQELSGLPKGDYKVTVHTFYRAGSYEEEEAAINNGQDTHLCKLYANGEEKPVVNLSEGAKEITEMPEGINTRTICGITVPDGTDASVACFNAGYYLNELNFQVGEDGKAVIGLKLEETIGTNDYVVVGQWNLYYYGDNSEAELDESNVSSLIVNNTLDPSMGNKDEKRIDGWTVEGALNGYKKYTASYNKGTFAMSQKLVGLPEGTYKVTVHTFYRAGSYEEEEAAINNGQETHLCKLYAQAEERYEKPVVNLSEGAKEITAMPEGINTRTICGITVPDGTDASVACFNAGYYLNELPFYVGTKGEATIGLYLPETIGTNDYVVVGEWNLYYYGSGNNVDKLDDMITPVERVENVVELHPVAYYSLGGVRLSAPQRGINIVKMSDGSAVKMIIK